MNNAFYFVVDEGLSDIASAQAIHIARMWECPVHIFVERRCGMEIREVKHEAVSYHYDRLTTLLPRGLPADAKWPEIVYLRLLVPRLLSHYRRLMYLDADVLCLKPDNRVWSLELSSGIGMVSDLATLAKAPRDLKNLARRDWLDSIGVSSESYGNSGVILIDPQRFSDNEWGELLPDYFRKFPAAARYDQDFLNHFFDGAWTELGPRFNYQAAVLELGYTKIVDPVFVHFCRRQKPWWGQKDNFYSPTDPVYTHIYDAILRSAGFDPQTYRRSTRVKALSWVKYWLYRRLVTNDVTVPRAGKELAAWRRRSQDFHKFFCQGLADGRFADEARSAIPETTEVPWFDGRFVRTWRT